MPDMYVSIPSSLENLKLPDPELVNYYKDAEKRIFYIDDEINENLLELSKEIIRINKEDKEVPRNYFVYGDKKFCIYDETGSVICT